MIIGITGQIGCGKSSVTGVFQSLGAEVIDADLIGKEVVETDSVVLFRLIMTFGKSILNSDNTLNRRQLGKLAFVDKESTEKLNRIVHPELLRRLDVIVASARRKHVHAIIDAALLIYWNYHKKVDKTILVTSTISSRKARIKAIGLSEFELVQRSKSQLSEAYLKKQSSIVLTNNGSLESLHKKARKLYAELTEKG